MFELLDAGDAPGDAMVSLEDGPAGQFFPRLGESPPSGWTAVDLELATEDPGELDDATLIDAMRAFQQLSAWADAQQSRVIAEFARRRPGDHPAAVMVDRPSASSRFAPDEIGMALSVSRGWASSLLGQARQLDEELREVLRSQERGELESAKVRAICDAVLVVSTEQATEVAARVLPRAPGQTLSQLRAALKRAVIDVDREGAARRHDARRARRRVSVRESEDGMASLCATLTAGDAHSAYEWVTRLARGCGADDPRSMDARRADITVGLLTGRLTSAPGEAAIPAATGTAATDTSAEGTGAGQQGRTHLTPVTPGKPLIQVVVPLTTLRGEDDQPCELVGYGAITAGAAREIATDAVWRRLVTDPLSGALLDYGRTTYRPPEALADFVRARDGYCRDPLCSRSAATCELDHVVPYPIGPTSEPNLESACLRSHLLKHAPGWHVVAHADGRITWRTPTGHTYATRPYDYRTWAETVAEPPRLRPPTPRDRPSRWSR